jgi:erythromycin esterase-like protein
MPTLTDTDLAATIREAAQPLTGLAADYDRLMRMVGDARFVLLGEASHGTHELYDQRALITQRLIVHGIGADGFAHEALGDFKRFPSWMWRNTVVAEFVDWLRAHNEGRGVKAGFYGMDLYSLRSSMAAVLEFLDKADPEAAKHARERYGCFERFGTKMKGFLLDLRTGNEACCTSTRRARSSSSASPIAAAEIPEIGL